MSRKTLITLSASVLLGAVIAAPNAALAQFGPPPGLGSGPPLGGPPAGPVAGLPPRVPTGAPPRDIAGGPPPLNDAGGLHGPERSGQANFRGFEGRAAAYSANSYTRNGYANFGYRHSFRYWALCGCGLRQWWILRLLRRRLLLRVYIQAIRQRARSDLSWKLIEADGLGAPVLHRGVCLLGRAQLACQGKFGT
jgi:hypothetical protein